MSQHAQRAGRGTIVNSSFSTNPKLVDKGRHASLQKANRYEQLTPIQQEIVTENDQAQHGNDYESVNKGQTTINKESMISVEDKHYNTNYGSMNNVNNPYKEVENKRQANTSIPGQRHKNKKNYMKLNM